MEKVVAPVIYSDVTSRKKRWRIKSQEVKPERKSRRKTQEFVVVKEIAVVVKSKSLNILLAKGSNGRRLRACHKLNKNKWDYFPRSKKNWNTCNRLLPTVAERENKKKKYLHPLDVKYMTIRLKKNTNTKKKQVKVLTEKFEYFVERW